MWYNEMFILLEKSGNKEKAEKMAAYMKNKFLFLGIQKPKLNEISKPYIKQAVRQKEVDWEFVEICWRKEYREAQYVALNYISAVKRLLKYSEIEKIKKVIIFKSWWDSVDCINKTIGDISLRESEIKSEMLNWSKADNLWLRRVAINYQLGLKENTDFELLEKIICNNFGSDEFFINKAIGWSLREYSKTNPEWVREFLKRNSKKMAKLSIKEASKYVTS